MDRFSNTLPDIIIKYLMNRYNDRANSNLHESSLKIFVYGRWLPCSMPHVNQILKFEVLKTSSPNDTLR